MKHISNTLFAAFSGAFIGAICGAILGFTVGLVRTEDVVASYLQRVYLEALSER